ncbi:MAG: hypothetical protein EKK43_04940 [Methylobacterium sp.]|nr:MAG: hypothetical protein EKK43_04940 [Methylobacterium sp.]
MGGVRRHQRWPREALVPSPVRERDRVRDRVFPDSAHPSPQPSPVRERGRVATVRSRGTKLAGVSGPAQRGGEPCPCSI